jgi:hypothetical protein
MRAKRVEAVSDVSALCAGGGAGRSRRTILKAQKHGTCVGAFAHQACGTLRFRLAAHTVFELTLSCGVLVGESRS